MRAQRSSSRSSAQRELAVGAGVDPHLDDRRQIGAVADGSSAGTIGTIAPALASTGIEVEVAVQVARVRPPV